jgi:transcriptional regulator of acetoin/glycerol metabolism
MAEQTGTMEGMGGARGAPDAPADAGLVVLYAPNHAALPPAFRLTGTTIIGREPPPGGLAIAQSAVSRVHASVAPMDGGFVIKDLDSRNGVLVNGAFVSERALAADDVIRIGDTLFKFVPADATGYARFRIDDPGVSLGGGVGGYRMSLLAERLATIARTDLPVVIAGETGTGKELAARAVHEASGRSGPLSALNCASIPSHLIESELFGWRRGAFSGADRDHVGLVRAADGGTLFLDEVGDMPLDAQAKLLRMLETRRVLPLGAAREVLVDVRVVCATHRDLQARVDEGAFRGDLFARINGYSFDLEPLRRRKEDLYRLVRHFLSEAGQLERGISLPLMVHLCHYDWPYNVRELKTTIRRAVAVAEADELAVRHLPDAIQAGMEAYGKKAPETNATASRAPRSSPPTAEALRALLERCDGNISAVARELGKDRVQIHRWMRLHGIRRDEREPR